MEGPGEANAPAEEREPSIACKTAGLQPRLFEKERHVLVLADGLLDFRQIDDLTASVHSSVFAAFQRIKKCERDLSGP